MIKKEMLNRMTRIWRDFPEIFLQFKNETNIIKQGWQDFFACGQNWKIIFIEGFKCEISVEQEKIFAQIFQLITESQK